LFDGGFELLIFLLFRVNLAIDFTKVRIGRNQSGD